MKRTMEEENGLETIQLNQHDFAKIQHDFIHLLYHSILHTPTSLLHPSSSSSSSSSSSLSSPFTLPCLLPHSLWVIGLVVDHRTFDESSLIRLRDLNTDEVIQLYCKCQPERIPLWSVVVMTDIKTVDREGEKVLPFTSGQSSLFTVPQTRFLHTMLRPCPQWTRWLELDCLFSWGMVEIERVLSVKVFQVCPRCMQSIVSRGHHTQNCSLPEEEDLPIYTESVFFGLTKLTRIKG